HVVFAADDADRAKQGASLFEQSHALGARADVAPIGLQELLGARDRSLGLLGLAGDALAHLLDLLERAVDSLVELAGARLELGIARQRVAQGGGARLLLGLLGRLVGAVGG